MAYSSYGADIEVSAAITTQNLVPTGTATANSAVEISTSGKNSVGIQVTGTYTGVLSIQARVLSTGVWVTLSGASGLLRDTGVYSATIPSAGVGLWQLLDCTGYVAIRVTALAAVTGTATVTVRSTVAVAGLSLDNALPAGSASIGSVVIASGTITTLSAITAGANAIGDVGLQYRATATGGATPAKVLTAASTNATLVKGSAGRLLGWSLTNTTAAVKAVHFHNLAAAPTVGTSVPLWTLILPPNAICQQNLPGGQAHATGISYSITGAIGDLDTTITAIGDVIGVIWFA